MRHFKSTSSLMRCFNQQVQHEAFTFLRVCMLRIKCVLLLTVLSKLLQFSLLIGQFLLLHGQIFLQTTKFHLQPLVVSLQVNKSTVFGLTGKNNKPAVRTTPSERSSHCAQWSPDCTCPSSWSFSTLSVLVFRPHFTADSSTVKA